MKITTAATHINKSLSKLEKDIGEPVFDEWIIVARTSNKWDLLYYHGSRIDEFKQEFHDDIEMIREHLSIDTLVGDFAFSHEGHGTGFDADMCIGEHIFVLFNNTEKNTSEITKNPRWKKAQIHFATLLDVFISNPVKLTPAD